MGNSILIVEDGSSVPVYLTSSTGQKLDYTVKDVAILPPVFEVTDAVWDMDTDKLTITFSNDLLRHNTKIVNMYSDPEGNWLVLSLVLQYGSNFLEATMHPDAKTWVKHSGLKMASENGFEVLDYHEQVATNIHDYPVSVINAPPPVTVSPEPEVTPDVTTDPDPTVTPDVTTDPEPNVTPPSSPPTYKAEIINPDTIRLTFGTVIETTPDVIVNFEEGLKSQDIDLIETKISSESVTLIVSGMDVSKPVTVYYDQHDSSTNGIASWIKFNNHEVPDGYSFVTPPLPRITEPVTDKTDTVIDTTGQIPEPKYTIEDVKADMAAKKKSGSSGNDYNSRPTFGKSHQTQRQIVEDGFAFNGHSLSH